MPSFGCVVLCVRAGHAVSSATRHAASATTAGSDEMPVIGASSGWPRSDVLVPRSVPLQSRASTAVETVLRTTDRCRFVACSSLTDVYAVVYMAWQEVPSGDDGRRHGDRRKGGHFKVDRRPVAKRTIADRGVIGRRRACLWRVRSKVQACEAKGSGGRRGAGGERKEQGQVAADAAAGPLRRVAGAGPHVRP